MALSSYATIKIKKYLPWSKVNLINNNLEGIEAKNASIFLYQSEISSLKEKDHFYISHNDNKKCKVISLHSS